ncbi:DUF2515 domain-containing protein [Paenibacillus sp. LMG 31456]|uniref:DUF2515 domain-containing protein n=1 Tax=Paenibacillus foliorum TaxID=2654974 RepID=A0A972GRE9_9BACL|nr:DUF2515 domain-containing protein [Paenibacillus foliorum]NOU92823.1 DUF2515 domain-containing protein [Paenibacillus foliorum]
MGDGGFRSIGMDLLQKLVEIPQELVHWAEDKTATLLYERRQLNSMQEIHIQPENVAALRALFNQSEAGSDKCGPITSLLSVSDQALVQRIREDTAYHNRNNVTRTMAYWNIFRTHPELHWAYLAHMVSRNGGWNMTDLRGELLPYLLNEAQRGNVFALLERANGLIFHDAYPQLLLYSASRRADSPLFHLLPHLQVSAFMRPIWELFWEQLDSALLTQALIVNEQNYIEQRIIQHPTYRDLVLNSLFFNAQSLLQLNQVVFPYVDGDEMHLAGLVLENFNNLHERIETGKKLYAILFGVPVVCEGAMRFANSKPHTASRADYWPQLFSSMHQTAPVPKGLLKERLDGCRLITGASPLYSPKLTNAWKNYSMDPPEPGDWFEHDRGRCLSYLASVQPPFSFEMTQEHGFGLNKIELAVLAGDIWQ